MDTRKYGGYSEIWPPLASNFLTLWNDKKLECQTFEPMNGGPHGPPYARFSRGLSCWSTNRIWVIEVSVKLHFGYSEIWPPLATNFFIFWVKGGMQNDKKSECHTFDPMNGGPH